VCVCVRGWVGGWVGGCVCGQPQVHIENIELKSTVNACICMLNAFSPKKNVQKYSWQGIYVYECIDENPADCWSKVLVGLGGFMSHSFAPYSVRVCTYVRVFVRTCVGERGREREQERASE